MLVGVYRDEFTDVIYINMQMGLFDFQLQARRRPETRAQAVTLARDFIQQIEFTGRVRWQLGQAGVITDEPRL
jgi:hypothetical protein